MAGERAFGFLAINEREGKPRRRGVTEIRGPYYTALGKRYLEDVLETIGAYVDTLKYAGGSFTLMPREVVRELNELCHRHQVEVSTGGFLEYVLTRARRWSIALWPSVGSSASTWSRSRAASSCCRSTTSSR